jgi:exonuclease VII small subunit
MRHVRSERHWITSLPFPKKNDSKAVRTGGATEEEYFHHRDTELIEQRRTRASLQQARQRLSQILQVSDEKLLRAVENPKFDDTTAVTPRMSASQTSFEALLGRLSASIDAKLERLIAAR